MSLSSSFRLCSFDTLLPGGVGVWGGRMIALSEPKDRLPEANGGGLGASPGIPRGALGASGHPWTPPPYFEVAESKK